VVCGLLFSCDLGWTEIEKAMTYLTVQQAAAYLQVPRSVIYANWRILGGVKIGRYIRISQEEIDKYIESQKQVVKGLMQKQILQRKRKALGVL
jgi:excisionase family DNA binding protein